MFFLLHSNSCCRNINLSDDVWVMILIQFELLSKLFPFYLIVSNICVIWSLYCVALPNYEVTMVVQPGFQPQTVDTPVLESGCPRSLFKPDRKVIMPMTRNNIIHILLYNRYKYNRQRAKERHVGHQIFSL